MRLSPRLLKGLAALLGLAFIAAVRMYVEARAEWRRGEELLLQGAAEEALLRFDRAVHWYAPGNPFVRRSLERLWEIGRKAEAEGRPALALQAYDSMRGGIYAIRSLYQPYGEKLAAANERIAALRAAEEVSRAGGDAGAALRFHRERLERKPGPRRGWALLAELGFFGWVGAAVGLIFKGFDRAGVMHLRPALPWIAGLAACFGLWILGMLRA